MRWQSIDEIEKNTDEQQKKRQRAEKRAKSENKDNNNALAFGWMELCMVNNAYQLVDVLLVSRHTYFMLKYFAEIEKNTHTHIDGNKNSNIENEWKKKSLMVTR